MVFSVVQQTRDAKKRLGNVLYLPCRRIERSEILTPAFKKFVAAMYATMQKLEGIGIAANQVGKSLQVFIIEAGDDSPRYEGLGGVPYQLFINPKINQASADLRNFWHGCLSGEGEKRGNVSAYEWIEYECLDETAQKRTGRLEGLAAVIFQHELRHLLGGTYLDRALHFLSPQDLKEAVEVGDQNLFEPTNPLLPHLISDYRLGETLEEYYERRQAEG